MGSVAKISNIEDDPPKVHYNYIVCHPNDLTKAIAMIRDEGYSTIEFIRVDENHELDMYSWYSVSFGKTVYQTDAHIRPRL